MYSFNLPTEKNDERRRILEEKSKAYLTTVSEEQRNSFAAAYASTVWKVTKSVYVDISMVLDIHLGALLWITRESKDAFSHIVNQLDIYTCRIFDKHAEYFPELKISEQQLLDYIKDPRNTLNILASAPPTDLWKDILQTHLESIKMNRIVKENDVEPIKYIINMHPLPCTEQMLKVLKIKFMKGLFDDKIVFGGFSTEYDKLAIEQVIGHDYIYTYRFGQWFENIDAEKLEMYMSGPLIKSKIKSPPLLTNKDILDSYSNYTNPEIIEILENTAMYYNLFTNFQYVKLDIPSFAELKMLDKKDENQ